MSFGIHRYWKDYFVQRLDLPNDGGNTRVIDVAGGTGDLALRMKSYKSRYNDNSYGDKNNGIDVTVVDINNDMLQEGMKKEGGEGKRGIEGINMYILT